MAEWVQMVCNLVPSWSGSHAHMPAPTGSGSGLGRRAPYFTCCVGAPNRPTRGHNETNFHVTPRSPETPWRRIPTEGRSYTIPVHYTPYSLFRGWEGGCKRHLLGAALNRSKVRISSRRWLLSNYRRAVPPRTCPQSHLCTRAPHCARPTVRAPAPLLPSPRC